MIFSTKNSEKPWTREKRTPSRSLLSSKDLIPAYLNIRYRMLKSVGLDEEGNDFDEDRIKAKKELKEKKVQAKKEETKFKAVYMPDA